MSDERTAEEVAKIFEHAGHSVSLINGGKTSEYLTDSDWKDAVKCNWQHLEIIKAYKKSDGNVSIWTSEDFTAINSAITAGKAIQA
jgi:hypothetical protein